MNKKAENNSQWVAEQVMMKEVLEGKHLLDGRIKGTRVRKHTGEWHTLLRDLSTEEMEQRVAELDVLLKDHSANRKMEKMRSSSHRPVSKQVPCDATCATATTATISNRSGRSGTDTAVRGREVGTRTSHHHQYSQSELTALRLTPLLERAKHERDKVEACRKAIARSLPGP